MPQTFVIPTTLPFAKERGLGKAAMLSPLIFGKTHTSYEQITCVGYHPELEELYAVIQLKLPQGYGGDVCSPGTMEFVRFYMSFDGGATWKDMGVTAVPAYDIGTSAPVDVAATLRIDAPTFPCSKEKDNVVLVRAILSWQVEPPRDTPGFRPSWGNVMGAVVQLDPIPLAILPKLAIPKLPLSFKPLEPIALPYKPKIGSSLLEYQPKPALAAPKPQDIIKKYAAAKVPSHRVVLPFVKSAKIGADAALAPTVSAAFAAENIDLGAAITALAAQQGDKTFEELTCVGLDPLRKQLVGVIHVKLPNGFSGTLCQAGSKEYVAFWVDWGNTGTWTYEGTAEVTVHDILSIGPDGLRYAVALPVSLREHQKVCNTGPNTVKVRGVLSWQTPPSTTDPNAPPHWGNAKDTKVLLPAAAPVQAGELGFFQGAGAIAVGDIGPRGFTLSHTGSGAVPVVYGINGNSFLDAPFGGLITLHGELLAPVGTRYRFHYRELNPSTLAPISPFIPLLANYPTPTTVNQKTGPGGIFNTPVPLGCDADGWYVSLPNIRSEIMAIWYTNASQTGRLYELCLEVEGDTLPMANRPKHRLFIDNTEPEAVLTLDNPNDGQCWDKTQGEDITGSLTARADYIDIFGFTILPPIPAGFPTGNPSSAMTVRNGTTTGPVIEPENWDYPDISTVEGLPQGINSGKFALKTDGMRPCGYSLTLTVWSRTNVNSGYKRGKPDHVGFCVKPKT